MLSIDGSYGEAGGQIVRTSLAFSTLTKKPFWIKDIRKNRPNPGLKHQHLNCVKALEKLCNAKPKMNLLGSTELFYTPNKIEGKTINIDIGTAGSITLLLQSILLPSLFADKKTIIKMTGGTDVPWSPSFDYFNSVLIPQLRRFANIELTLEKRGYYPKGNGTITIKVNPKYNTYTYDNFGQFKDILKEEITPINMTDQGQLIQIKGVSHASKDLQEAEVAERQAESARLQLSKLSCPIQIRTEYQNTLSTGSGITLWAQFLKDDSEEPIILGSDKLGERRVRSEIVGSTAADQLIKEIRSGAPVDKHLADQLLPFFSLISSEIHTSELTPHTLTNINTISYFLGDIFKIDKINSIITTNKQQDL